MAAFKPHLLAIESCLCVPKDRDNLPQRVSVCRHLHPSVMLAAGKLVWANRPKWWLSKLAGFLN